MVDWIWALGLTLFTCVCHFRMQNRTHATATT